MGSIDLVRGDSAVLQIDGRAFSGKFAYFVLVGKVTTF
jgi:hypothetical protein